MELVSVYETLDAPRILYQLLREREAWQSISHKAMPSEADHMSFYLSRPYLSWCLIAPRPFVVGAVYLTKQREIGVFVFKRYRGNGFGKNAIRMMMEHRPGAFLANVNPANEPSKKLFEGLGFKKIQETYAL